MQARIEDFIQECGTHSIPCSAFHFGSGYSSIDGKRYTFNWNRDKFPDPEGLVAKFNAAGMRVAANLKPCLLDDHPMFPDVVERGAFIAGASGEPSISQFWDGEGAHLDFTNPAAIKWCAHMGALSCCVNPEPSVLGRGGPHLDFTNPAVIMWCAHWAHAHVMVSTCMVAYFSAAMCSRIKYEPHAQKELKARNWSLHSEEAL